MPPSLIVDTMLTSIMLVVAIILLQCWLAEEVVLEELPLPVQQHNTSPGEQTLQHYKEHLMKC
jgi:hypothetical protein